MPFSTRILSHGLLPAALSLLCVACVPQSRLDRANTDLAAAQARIKSLEQDLATTRAALDRAKADASNPAPCPLSAAGSPPPRSSKPDPTGTSRSSFPATSSNWQRPAMTRRKYPCSDPGLT